MRTASTTCCLLLLATSALATHGADSPFPSPAASSRAAVPAPFQLTGPSPLRPVGHPTHPAPCHAAGRKLRGYGVTGGAGGYPTSATSEGGGTGPLLATALRWHSFLASSKQRIRYNATLASEAGR